jgi:hypothetical protein
VATEANGARKDIKPEMQRTPPRKRLGKNLEECAVEDKRKADSISVLPAKSAKPFLIGFIKA